MKRFITLLAAVALLASCTQ
ncbi:lipoprotein [Exiguobacterium sp. SH31]